MILLRLAAGRPRHTGVLGGLLLTLLLLWAYFQFMPFLIVWSGNLPDGVGWYLARRSSGWVAAIVAAAVLGGVPLFALFAPQVRQSPRWLGWCAMAVLAGKAAGMVTAWVAWGADRPGSVPGVEPDYVLIDMSEVLPLVRGQEQELTGR